MTTCEKLEVKFVGGGVRETMKSMQKHRNIHGISQEIRESVRRISEKY